MRVDARSSGNNRYAPNKDGECILDSFHLKLARGKRPRSLRICILEIENRGKRAWSSRSKIEQQRRLLYLDRKRYLHGLRTIEIVTSPWGLYSRERIGSFQRFEYRIAYHTDWITMRYALCVLFDRNIRLLWNFHIFLVLTNLKFCHSYYILCTWFYIRLSGKFLSFHKVIINFCLILFYWIRYDPFRSISIIMYNSIN